MTNTTHNPFQLKRIVVATDCQDDFAKEQTISEIEHFIEVICEKLGVEIPRYTIGFIGIPSFNNSELGFVGADRAIYGRPGTAVFVNAAKRAQKDVNLDDDESLINVGEDYFAALVDIGNGNVNLVFGPNAGTTFSRVKPRIIDCFENPIPALPDTQFRSRDKQPSAFVRFALNDPTLELVPVTDIDAVIPDPHPSEVVFVDSFENIKLGVTEIPGNPEPGDSVILRVGDYKINAVIAGGVFEQRHKENPPLVIAPGSNKNHVGKPYLELFHYGGRATEYIAIHGEIIGDHNHLPDIESGTEIEVLAIQRGTEIIPVNVAVSPQVSRNGDSVEPGSWRTAPADHAGLGVVRDSR